MSVKSLIWLRNDLRIKDNPALNAAVKAARENDRHVFALYILDEESVGLRPLGSASKWWLYHSLKALEKNLNALNIQLILKKGAAQNVLTKLINEENITHLYWNRAYGDAQVVRDKAIKKEMGEKIKEVKSLNGTLLIEPWQVETGSGDFYKVFTPFSKVVRGKLPLREILKTPETLDNKAVNITSDKLEEWDLLPSNPDWSKGFDDYWQPGEDGAEKHMKAFLEKGLNNYKKDRDIPSKQGTSRLSPHLHFGEISPYQIWFAAQNYAHEKKLSDESLFTFHQELLWREFSYHLLFYNEALDKKNFKNKFDAFPWCSIEENHDQIKAWQKGQTGYPIVDAGMRQLWQKGWMHNRVRMIVGSFLVKHLLIDWRVGEEWFWDTLVDADPASNSASWQWVAGTGADASPYFRIFNPTLQSEKFDNQGVYIKEFVPELKNMPAKYIHKPSEAPKEVLREAGIILGKDYPYPIIDHKEARQRALDAYEEIKG